LFAPLKSGSNNLAIAAEKIMPFGSSKMECDIERNSIRSFNKMVIPHSSIHPTWVTRTTNQGFSDRLFFAVLVLTDGHNNLAVKVIFQKSILKLKWDAGQPKAQFINSSGARRNIALPLNTEASLPGVMGTTLKNIGNKVLFGNNDAMDLEFNAEEITLRVSTIYKNQLSGLCGSSNLSMKGVASTSLSSCRYSKPALEVASNLLQNGAGAPLDNSIKEALRKEQAQCQRKSVLFYGV